MKDQRVAILWANDFPPVVSGIATYFYNLWRVLPEDSTVIVAPKAAGYRAFDAKHRMRVRRVWLPLGRTGFSKLAKTFLTIFYSVGIAASGARVMFHCGQVLSSGIAGWLCKKLFGIPYVVYVYGSETVRLGRGKGMAGWMRRVLGESQWVVPNSDFTLQEYRDFGVPDKKIVKITPGVDTAFFHPEPANTHLVRRFGLEGCRVLLTVSRLDERKGHDKVIEALPVVLERFPETRYLIVGRGREEGRLRALVERMGLEGQVIFAGYIPDEELPAYYNLCDLFVLPNRETEDFAQLRGDYEGFGIVFLEAGACAKPVIGGRSGGVEEAVVNGVTGLLVHPRSTCEVAEAVIRILGDGELARRLGREGRNRAQEFDWRKLATQVQEILV
jgi:phosphatidylinositol alpha-1,6-mannosyltransferase